MESVWTESDFVRSLAVPVEPDQDFVHPMHEIGVDPAKYIYLLLSLVDGLIITYSPNRVLTTEYADWAEMDRNQADQKCVRIWDWSEVEDSDVGGFTETDSWGTFKHHEGFMNLTSTFRVRRTSHGYCFQPRSEYMATRGR
jgi:hypothetical protein